MPAASDVEFVTVNTDPTALAQSAEAPVLSKTGLGALPNWHMVTGPLATLNAVWKAYGVSISVDKKTGLEAHNDVMAFIDGRGDLRYRATPFADESTTGTFSLPPASIARWGQGIATYAEAAGRPVTDPDRADPERHRSGSATVGCSSGSRSSSCSSITVLTDLPVSTSRADDINAERSVMSEVNTDLAGCALAVHQAIGIWNLQAAHALTPADRAPTPGPVERRPVGLLLHEREHL